MRAEPREKPLHSFPQRALFLRIPVASGEADVGISRHNINRHPRKEPILVNRAQIAISAVWSQIGTSEIPDQSFEFVQRQT